MAPARPTPTPATPPRFDAGRPCLDLLATTHPHERLTSLDHLRTWITTTGLVPTHTPLDHATPDWLTAFQELRTHIAQLIHTATGPHTEHPPPPTTPHPFDTSLAHINDIARTAPPAPQATRTTTSGTSGSNTNGSAPFALTRTLAAPPTCPALLAVLARDTVELLTDPTAYASLRRCAGDNCPLVYVDTSRGRRRRWCSSEVCGNRERVARHRRRTALPRA
ncbi:hypothetical protein SGFS_048930 [Streptomyces graminofaciens]|uniref:Zinc finger CGNR domain-containing protein n=1 Tax=Streptomyces graminofaciens TaxID=68212 RepID=A0ABN5VJS9_9ACTN|nr:CGNR zinc finger domain-containing protein [Streptomyces graminofaciens]BBC33599.1 hypothetical protein SGFS_048930 [Streptomyces graminofaciens]